MKLRLFFLIAGLFFSFQSFGQKLINSRQDSYNTYIYQLTDAEARQIYEGNTQKVNESFFHTLVDMFPSDSVYIGKLPAGHYLKTKASKNEQTFEITTIQDFDVFILNNNTDLCVQVYDLRGNLLPDAKVSVKGKRLQFDAETKLYIDRKSNKKGLLTVEYNNFSAYYDLKRQYNNSNIKRGTRKVVFGTPLKYVWVPVNYVVHLPVDGVKSISKGYNHGTIRRTKDFFVRQYHNIIEKENYDDLSKVKGYMVFNKPKYEPGDTVKFKAWVSRKGKLMKKPLDVFLYTNKDVKLAELTPYRKGGYSWQFFLHDSLQLRLDTYYELTLTKGNKSVISESFKYEDYELSKTELTLKLNEKIHYRDSVLELIVNGTDENGLNLYDARLEVFAKVNQVTEYGDDKIFIPDTLLFIKQKLEPVGETKITISDSLFPRANFKYTISVTLLTSDNEITNKYEQAEYYYRSQKFDIKLSADSLHFKYLKNGLHEQKFAMITADDNFGNKTVVYEGYTPYSIEPDPFYSSYSIESDSLSESIIISEQSSLFQCFAHRTNDSIYITTDNPRKLPFNYTVYKLNNERAAGHADSLDFKQKTLSKQKWFVSICYIWGGKVVTENYNIPFIENKLNIKVSQPKIIYPGQKSKIEVLVTDTRGNPVEGVDLTAFSLTKKFDYTPPTVPSYNKNRKNKDLINNFHFGNNERKGNMNLNYEAWKLLASLDSVEYYRFIYPADSIYRFEYQTPEQITQFAPFVVHNGEIQPVHIVYCDNQPVYFSWSTNQPYSIRVNSGHHQIVLRTSHHKITIDKVYFPIRKKLILSVDTDTKQKGVYVEDMKPSLSDSEQRALYPYIFPYRNTFGDNQAWIENNNNIYLLSNLSQSNTNSQQNNRTFLTGPVVGDVRFHLTNKKPMGFKHEQLFEYEFGDELLKMRTMANDRLPKNLRYHNNMSLSDTVLTKKGVSEQWQKYIDFRRQTTTNYSYTTYTKAGLGTLHVAFDKAATQPLNIVMLRHEDHQFLRIYPGSASHMYDLEKGNYQLIFLYSGGRYHKEDSITVQQGGLNYYRFKELKVFDKDSFSIKTNKIIEEIVFSRSNYDKEEGRQNIFNTYRQQFPYEGPGKTIEGHVYDKEGEPLPGVNVIARGTVYGAVTDINGHYKLRVPFSVKELNFSFIGFVPSDVDIPDQSVLDVRLSESYLALDEIVVTAKGLLRETRALGYSVSTSSQNTRIMGVLHGRAAGVRLEENYIKIRGSSSFGSDPPIIVINGQVYTGDMSKIDPQMIESMEVIKGNEATAIFGARAANGVVVITTKDAFQTNLQGGADFDETFLEAASQASSIRENFSDYAFWQPTLATDKEGKATFDVIFPDDVTSWQAVFLAMNGKKQSGQTQQFIKSYKPLMAQLSVPSFLVASDTSLVIGKTLNYMADSALVTTRFEINETRFEEKTRNVANSLLDTLAVIATGDSVSVKYMLEKDDYFDGELRHIPVHPIGLEEAKGEFYAFDNDTTINLTFDSSLGDVSLYARADVIDVLQDEIRHVVAYRYDCNEQLASKLKALLALKKICAFRNEKFKSDDEINKIIRLLKKNMKESLWGWWPGSEVNYWISLHTIEALTDAEKQGYKIDLNKAEITSELIWQLNNSQDFDMNVRALKILKLINANADFSNYISRLEKTKKMSLMNQLQLIELKQLTAISYKIDLEKHRKRSLFGNIYFSENDSTKTSLTNNDLQTTLLAYKILRNDSTANQSVLPKIRNYFLENRKSGYWRNTYESAQIIEAIMPDIIKGKSIPEKPELVFSGGLNKTVTEFPFESKVKPEQNISVTKTGDFPVYFTAWQQFWNSKPEVTKNDFEISTYFTHGSTMLDAGKEVTLKVHVKIKADAEYVMINIPVPAGCSYTDKSQGRRWIESHREYFKHETAIFCQWLPKGEYDFEIKLMPRYTGNYTLNPAKIELMYFPTFRANEEVKRVKIK